MDSLQSERLRVYIGSWGEVSGPLDEVAFCGRNYYGESGYCPEWLSGDVDDHDYCVTIVCSPFDNLISDGAPGWTVVATYDCGEHDCPWCGDGTGREHDGKDCELCEGEGCLYDTDVVVVLRPRSRC